jgi:uncharacterized protein (DUF433 family)
MSASPRGRAIARHPSVQSASNLIPGTTVPVATLLRHLGRGLTLEAFLADNPSVRRDTALAAVAEAADLLDVPCDVLDLRGHPALEEVWSFPGDDVFDEL